jgi:hypothetical protein
VGEKLFLDGKEAEREEEKGYGDIQRYGEVVSQQF